MINAKTKYFLSLLCSFAVLLTYFQTAAVAEDYIIAVGDKLHISVWGNKDLNSKVTVRTDGKISFPLVGEIKAGGTTPMQLREKLTNKLAEFINNPLVTINVVETHHINVFIYGNSKLAGPKRFKGNTNLLQLFSMLGKLPSSIDLKTSFIVRNNERLTVDLYKLLKEGDLSQNIYLKNGDTIFFKEIERPKVTREKPRPLNKYENMIRIVGEVKREAAIPFEAGMTILDAISIAGGVTPYARPSGTKVIRRHGDKIEEILIDLDAIRDGAVDKNISLEPGDLISVPASLF